MTDPARRAYLALGRGFLALGGAIAALAVADAALALGLFRGSPLGTALFLAVVGGLLVWTVRQADAAKAEEADVESEAREGIEAPEDERRDDDRREDAP